MQKIHKYVSSFWMISLHPGICALQLHNLALEEMIICKNVFDNHICFELKLFFSNYLHVSWWIECNINASNIIFKIEFQLCYDSSGSICSTNF